MKRLIIMSSLLLTASSQTFARPIYAIKEMKPCLYCHVNPKGGGIRNPRGVYYAEHGRTFKDYDEEKVMGQYKPQLLRKVWTETLPASVRRIGVGDTVGDGANRLVLLSEGETKDKRVLSVRKWDKDAWKTEFSADIKASSDRLAVGKFCSGKSAVIVTSNELFYWDGKSYVKKSSPKVLGILGSISLKSGGERLLIKDGTGLKVHSVDVNAENWLGPGSDPPPAAYASFTDMKSTTDELKAIGMPDLLAAGGVVGLWETQKANLLFLYGIQVSAITVDKPGAKVASEFEIKRVESHLIIADPRSAQFRPLWHSDALTGTVLDVTINDPKTGAKGIAVLSDNSEDGKGHTLCFYQLD